MAESQIRPGKRVSFVERRIRRIVNARSVTLGLAVTFLGLALTGGILIRFVDHENFPSVGVGIWWALQTVTTVGYGDVAPKNGAGRLLGAIVMLEGTAFIAIVTAVITSSFVTRAQAEQRKEELSDRELMEKRFDELERKIDALAAGR